ncbi:Hypothetical protein R9X50_00299500 [Acrodontium crateriforme]|uniref:PCI domain-containing protein n=1 Tax=Acrodontium crateriforme TaxID=150365 RepID=A0AAQ3M363_9PEZI|nr:Hypothetical protein R9X50_00299500 [Acrodontium crateriforme]
MATPTISQFLTGIDGFVSSRNATELADYLTLEPPFGDIYHKMIAELRQAYPAHRGEELEQMCGQALKTARSESWNAFIKFMAQYLAYLRDVSSDADQYLATYESLSELLQRANSALANVELGHLMLPTVISCAKCVCRLAIGLDKRPELIAHLRSATGGGDDGGVRESLPEQAANIVRGAFVTCLNDRSSGGGVSNFGKPQGKTVGIFVLANLCLKILFQCRKTRNATQIFENIYNLAPPLAAYPKSERVAYLYYLGRFLFTTAQFSRARRALQAAYDESPARPDCARQRRHILIYLLTCNILLGRFPSDALLSRPEADGLAMRFSPLCQAIQKGDVASYRRHLDLNSPHASWFLIFRLLIPLRHRGEVLVWRSLIRRAWLINGTRPRPDSRVAPQVDLHDLVTYFTYFDTQDPTNSPSDEPDADLAETPTYPTPHDPMPPLIQTEAIVASLITQRLINGFISHARAKFAITGVKNKNGDVLAAGFPTVASVLTLGDDEASDVPGWPVKKPSLAAGMLPRPGPGMVFNLSGARGVGA